MKVCILQEEWICATDYKSEKAYSTQVEVYKTFEDAEREWADRSNRRHDRQGHWVEPAEKDDINSNGESIRYYIMHFGDDVGEVMIKTTIAERNVL